jgi:thiol-disulfide isomerase/thioredoxin
MKIATLARIASVILALSSTSLVSAQTETSKSSADLLDQIVKASDRNQFYPAYSELSQRMDKGGAEGEAATQLILSHREEITSDQNVGKLVEKLKNSKKPRMAAQLLLQIAKANNTVKSFNKGNVAVGQVVVADGKLDPQLVLAQMEILPEGYFAGEIGDLERPLGFRAEGYSSLDVPLKGRNGEVVYLGAVTLNPLPADQAATLKGTVKLDDFKGMGTATLQLSLSVPKPNTPHNGFSPRRRWPDPIKVAVSDSGEFKAAGLTPSTYTIIIEAKGHTQAFQQVSLVAGQEKDAGAIRLKATDLGFYIGKSAPKTGELAWEKDYASALKKAGAEKKPIMVMMTATWCGHCKMLEKETLNDPWIRHFLSKFVIVQVFEDKDIEKTYGLNGYPTLVFTDSKGKEGHRTVGYQGVVPFAGVCAIAFAKLDQKLPEELQRLVDQKVIQIVPAR